MLNRKIFDYEEHSSKWSDYIHNTNKRETIQPFLIQLVELQKDIDKPKYATDIGCGAGNELLYLIKNGYQTIGLDANKDAVSEATIKCQDFEGCKISQHDLNIPPALPPQDLIYSFAVIFFLPKKAVHNLIISLSKQLNPNGLLGFNLIGINDDWAIRNNDIPISTFNEREIIDLLAEANLQVISLTEHEYNTKLADGSMKHWHEFRIIGQNIRAPD